MTAFEAVPLHHRDRSTSTDSPLALRLRVHATRGRLDRQLAAGRPCESTAALSLRARQLTHPRARQRVARDLRGIVDYVDRLGSPRVVSAVVIEPAAVRRARQPILGLAERLEGAAPVSPRGVALARALLTDGLSPLFNQYCERTVTQAIWAVEDALEANARQSGFDTAAFQ